MKYYCPHCASRKKPTAIKFFPPITVKCLECGYRNHEYKFTREDNTPTSQS